MNALGLLLLTRRPPHRWDINKLHAHYWDEKKRVLKAVGIKKKKKKKKGKLDKNAMVECMVCFDDVLPPFLHLSI